MNWPTVWGKIRYVVIPLVCLVTIVIVYNYATGRPDEEKTAQTKKKTEPARLDRMDLDAAKIHLSAISVSLSGIDREVARRARIQSEQNLQQLGTGRISIDDARMSTMSLANNMLVQNRFRVEVDETVKKANKPVPDKDWLDEILDSNPRKFLLVIVVGLTLALLAAALFGKAEIRKAAWTIALVLIAFLVVNQIWGGLIPSGSPAPIQQQQIQQKVIRVQIPPNNQLSDWVKLPHRRYTWSAPGDVEFVLPDGRTIKVANGNTNYKLGRVFEFRLHGDPGEAVFTLD